ncbi:MAG TPA: hypothetical protein VJR47_21810 [Stellaceae bacterium]|nr:hypothetical protein [Stellaceae bacterium]
MDRIRTLASVSMIAALLGGCTHVVHLRNAKTGETASCGGEMFWLTSAETDEHCLAYFHKQGFDPID